jgi:hypothetical protein
MRWQKAYSVIDSRTDTNGLFSWSFDPLFPVDGRHYAYNNRKYLRLNRHDYFELMSVLQSRMLFQVQSQRFDLGPGDLIVIGSMCFHRPIGYALPPAKAVVLGFLSDVVLGKNYNGDDVEYLMPFLAQGPDFPNLVSAKTGIPAKILDLIEQITLCTFIWAMR